MQGALPAQAAAGTVGPQIPSLPPMPQKPTPGSEEDMIGRQKEAQNNDKGAQTSTDENTAQGMAASTGASAAGPPAAPAADVSPPPPPLPQLPQAAPAQVPVAEAVLPQGLDK